MLEKEEDKLSMKKSLEAMQEMVEGLTQTKLADATKIDGLTKQIESKENALKDLQNQTATFTEMSIENETLKRQLKRLTEENDDLLSQLQEIESKPSATSVNDEIEKLKAELAESVKLNEEKSRENKSMKDLMDNNSMKIKKLIQEKSELKSSLESRDDTTPAPEIKIKYDKCIKKLKLYREKLIEFSERLAVMKSDKDVLLTTTKEYSESVNKWQKDIANASTRMILRLRESEEKVKKHEAEIEAQKIVISSLKSTSQQAGESKDAQVKTLEGEVQKLKELVQSKEKSLNEEREAQKKLKQAAKKSSVLDLELEAYEKTLEELNRKLEAKKVEVTELEGTLKMQNDTMDALKSQIISLEANVEAEKSHSADTKKNLDAQLSLLRTTEHERTEANLQLELLTKNYESLKLENGEIKLETAKHVGDLEKRYQTLETERDELVKTISFLESEVDKFKKLSSSHEKEIENLRTEFASYKLRAQSVLRQSQTKDLSKEQELQDDIITLQKTIESLKDSNNKVTHELEGLKKNFNDTVEDKVRLQGRCKDLLEALEKQSEEVLEESRTRNQQNEEAIKAYQLQIDTLNAFYKKKIQETEESNTTAVADLQAKISKLEKATVAAQPHVSAYEPVFQMRHEEHKLGMLMMDREEAEGSEDQSSQSSAFHQHHRRKISKGTRELMPLDELLNASFDDNSNEINEETISNYSSPSEMLEHTRAKLAREENRVSHLTTLLADSEKDLARMQQLNDMLKEEVRRQQRNNDREEHIKNSEYLKNVVIKFATLGNGDEKQRLIPVLNTILKLSSEENKLLQNACKSGWGGLWSN